MYDVKYNSFKKVYSLPEPQQQFVFANSLLLDKNNSDYYALIFPNDRFNDSLQLIKGSLTKPVYSLLGKPFPYSFNDVRSFADLYYCEKSKLLIAVTLYTSNDNITEAKVYTIHFPPNQLNEPGDKSQVTVDKTSSFNWINVILFLGVSILIVFYLGYRKRRLKTPGFLSSVKESEHPLVPKTVYAANTIDSTKINSHQEDMTLVAEEIFKHGDALHGNEDEIINEEDVIRAPRGRIMLFGYFEIITADGQNITRQFTPLLKEMFLLILIDSLRYDKGVSSEKLNDILWNGKDIKDAKNNRSVNLVKLKNILEKLGGCNISRETGAWKF
jgi:hypothetical protein